MSGKAGATGGAGNNASGDNANATGGDNTGENTGATAGAENTEGQTGAAQTTATGQVAFTPEQQTWINNKLAEEKRKATEAANKKAAEEKDLSEKEKAEKRATEAETALAERDKRDAFKTAIEPAKVVDGNALYKLIDGDLEFENGKFKNLSKVLDSAKVSYPYLFPKAESSANGGEKDDDAVIEAQPGVDRMAKAYEESSKAKS